MNIAPSGLRTTLFTKPLFALARRALPSMSDTERQALEVGDTWWDAELFTGNPDWQELLDCPAGALSEEEQAFLDGPCERLCAMIDDWDVNWHRRDLPPQVWSFLKTHRFFGMIIPKRHGGLGFSALAHSEVVRKIASRSATAAVTVMVPNSLGPGELLLQFGTRAQQAYWLPRLARGLEIPCFGLTSPEAGSDAAAMQDRGVICEGRHPTSGESVLGMRLNWHKRYITLGPVATVLGLAFKLSDPHRLLGDTAELGITVALVPTHLPGIEIGRRHLPSYQSFQNGPNRGRDVFVPLHWIIGGPDRIGDGWMMLMSALAVGRGISLPSLSAAATALSARTTGAYARVREQFGIPIGQFEGVQARLARLAGVAYQLDAARTFTCCGLDQGLKLSVISAIMKAHATYRMRVAVDDAMDVHAGKAVIDGPRNYLGALYRAVPVGITVEGANILTRNLIVFGQGAIRCHPYLRDELHALQSADTADGLRHFDRVVWRHVGHIIATAARTCLRNWSGTRLAPNPTGTPVAGHFRMLSSMSSTFALLADAALLSLGGELKRRELLSARLGDILSELFLASAVLKRFHDDGHPAADRPVVDYCLSCARVRMDLSIRQILQNLPNRLLATALRPIVQPLRPSMRGPTDELIVRTANLLQTPSATRERLTAGLHLGTGADAVAVLERAFEQVCDCAPLEERLRDADCASPREGLERGIIDRHEHARLVQAATLVSAAIEVDDFDPATLTPMTADAWEGNGSASVGVRS
ncbi:MAG: acyl-CoA dehydrogenase [Gammaproteobacteria bacterium]|nr:acyl-CoA dehydrogenase [Gammaproteobacteria bacterium]